MASLKGDIRRAQATSPGHCEQPEGARTDDRDARARSGPGETERVPRHSGRFHDRRITDVKAGRQGDQSGRGRTEVLRHAAVGTDAEGTLTVGRA